MPIPRTDDYWEDLRFIACVTFPLGEYLLFQALARQMEHSIDAHIRASLAEWLLSQGVTPAEREALLQHPTHDLPSLQALLTAVEALAERVRTQDTRWVPEPAPETPLSESAARRSEFMTLRLTAEEAAWVRNEARRKPVDGVAATPLLRSPGTRARHPEHRRAPGAARCDGLAGW